MEALNAHQQILIHREFGGMGEYGCKERRVWEASWNWERERRSQLVAAGGDNASFSLLALLFH